MANLPKGVTITPNNTIQIAFSYKGVSCRERFSIKPTKQNIAWAEKKLTIVKAEIATNQFEYAAHFPDSKKAALFGTAAGKQLSVAELRELWLAIKEPDIAFHTHNEYRKKSKYIIESFGPRKVNTIRRSEIERFIAVDLNHLANKTKNEILIVLRGMFKLAQTDGLIPASPMEAVENRKVVREEPDPFTKKEIAKITQQPTDRIMERSMYVFGIWTGLRTGELFALSWDDLDIDWINNKGKAYIRRNRTGGEFKVPKTKGSIRTIELLAPAIDQLRIMRAYTELHPPVDIKVRQMDNRKFKSEKFRCIFKNTHTGMFHHTDQIRDTWWVSFLKKAKVRYRPPYHVRHTYASQLLSTGKISKDWIAMQMGHTSTKMLEEVYAKWIPEDTPDMAELVNTVLGFTDSSSEPTTAKIAGNSQGA